MSIYERADKNYHESLYIDYEDINCSYFLFKLLLCPC